jgi:pimeloyl-ACP methyl ester carboxylesterase
VARFAERARVVAAGRLPKLSRAARFGLALFAVAAVIPAAYVAAKTYAQQVNVFFPKRKPVAATLEASEIPRVGAVTFGPDGARLHGWYAPSLRRAAVVLVHGAGGDRASLAVESRALSRAGFGVLTFDLPGHGESAGAIHWTDGERAALRGALDFVGRKPDVAPECIGVLGFSLGGYVAAQVAAHDRRVAALALLGTPSDPVAQANLQHGRFGFLTRWPALFALRRGGMDLEVRARDYVPRLSPRPLLLVTGTADGTVPRSMAEELFRAAAEPKELYVVEGAGHGDYAAAAPSAYEARLVEFFERSLGARRC